MNAIHAPMLRRSIARRRRTAGRRRLRGSVVINAVIALSLVLIVLVGTELGYFFYMKRELQKAADLSALAGTQILRPSNCTAATSAAAANAAQNLPALAPQQYDFTATCGNWDPATIIAAPHFGTPTAAGPNAIHVSIVGRPALLFPMLPGNGLRAVRVDAYAVKDAEVAVFSVGSKLVDINSAAPLISLLKFVGADPSGTCLACYTGLAGVKLTPGGLLAKLGIPVSADINVGDLNALLANSTVKLGDLLNAFVQLVGKDSLLGVNADLLASLVRAGLSIDGLDVKLGGKGGLFAEIQAPSGSAALNAQVDVFDLVKVAIGIGTGNHAVELAPDFNLLGLQLKIEARVVEPASIGVGGVGTTAYNSQVRVYVLLRTDPTQLLGGLLGALGTQINLPIAIDVVNAFGRLTNIDCDAAPPRATVHVEAPVLNACIGKIQDADLWSKSDVCTSGLTSMPMVTLLGLNLLNGKVAIPALNAQENVTLAVGQTQTTSRNPLPIGDTVATLVDQLLKLLMGAGSGGENTAANRAATPAVAAKLADYYLTKAGGNPTTVKNLLTADSMTWNRPAGLLLLFSGPMPDEFLAKANGLPLFGGCGGASNAACVRNALIASLQTPAQDGLVSGLLNGLVNLVTNLLGLGRTDSGTPLLSALLGPLISLLQPLLNGIGGLLSNLLGSTLGLELGRTDVHLQSVNCQNARLVY